MKSRRVFTHGDKSFAVIKNARQDAKEFVGVWIDYDYDYDYEHEHEHERITFGKHFEPKRPTDKSVEAW